eukprot:scaffold2086_cov133-Isochrysis_galbana.AAC.5
MRERSEPPPARAARRRWISGTVKRIRQWRLLVLGWAAWLGRPTSPLEVPCAGLPRWLGRLTSLLGTSSSVSRPRPDSRARSASSPAVMKRQKTSRPRPWPYSRRT